MADDIVIHGLRELDLALSSFPVKLQQKALERAMRASGRVIRDIARRNVPVKSGALRRSIGVSVIKRGDKMIARIVAGRRTKKADPFYAWMVEGGTKRHEIRPKGKKSLFLAGIFAEQIDHPGAKAKPFLGPALESGAQAALEAMRATLAEEIEKHGHLSVIEAAIKTIGGAHGALSALISTRLYAGQAPQNAALPYVVFEKDGYRPISAIYVDTAWGYSDFTFSAHAATLREALLVNEQVVAAFNRYFGTVGSVQIDPVGTLLTGQAEDDYDYELDHHVVDQGITFFHTGS